VQERTRESAVGGRLNLLPSSGTVSLFPRVRRVVY
jgi:hypothetical protein